MTEKNHSPRIVLVSRYFHPFIGGMEKQAMTVASALAKKGWRLHVLTSRVDRAWPAEEEIHNISITRLPTLNVKYIGAAIFLINLAVYLYRNRFSYAVVHAFQVGYTAALAISMANMLKKSSVLKLACSGPGGDIQKNRRSWLGRFFLQCCRKASAIVVLNEAMRQELLETGYTGARIYAIANGVDTERYYPEEMHRDPGRQPAGPKTILYAGRILFAQKRLDMLVRAAAKISDQDFKLLIIGNGPDAALLQEICRRLCLDDRVQALPAVTDTAPYLHAADIFILPSDYEGLSNSLLEAMASGLAIIATDIPGNRELIEDGVTGILVPCGDEARLTAAIRALLHDDATAAAMGKRAREKAVRKYALDMTAQSYSDLYGMLSKTCTA
jgi:glycosyltransferase involved in cell wall biosynthesis